MLIEFGTKAQTFVARSSAEAEIVALSRCMAQCGISMQLKYKPHLEGFCDAQAAIRAVMAGSSAQMRYIQKTQAVHLAWLRQLFESEDVSLSKIESENNPADIMTKSLPINKFSKSRLMLGIMHDV